MSSTLNNENLLILKNISHIYSQETQKIKVLNNININVMKGEMISLIGPSGTGKSTLLNLLSGLDCLDKGSLKWKERSIDNLSSSTLESSMGEVVLINKNLDVCFKQIENIILTHKKKLTHLLS